MDNTNTRLGYIPPILGDQIDEAMRIKSHPVYQALMDEYQTELDTLVKQLVQERSDHEQTRHHRDQALDGVKRADELNDKLQSKLRLHRYWSFFAGMVAGITACIIPVLVYNIGG